jgi:hypothetical protein
MLEVHRYDVIMWYSSIYQQDPIVRIPMGVIGSLVIQYRSLHADINLLAMTDRPTITKA